MKRTNTWVVAISLVIIPLTAGVVFADLAGLFSYSDTPFAVAFLLYTVFLIVQHTKSKTTFNFAFFLLIWMVLSYIPTGAGRITERIGEWFFLFFVFGLVQYTKEAWSIKEI